MQDMNIVSVIYIFFRLAPFLIVGFMTLGSVINGQIRGFVYLVGLCFSVFLTHLIVTTFANVTNVTNVHPNLICDGFSVNGIMNVSTPVGLAIICYTFFYLVFPIAKYRLEVYNIPLLIIFPLLIIAEIFWNVQNSCFDFTQIISTIILGGGLGVLYSVIIDSLKMPKLQYLAAGSTREICNMPRKQKFRCYNND